MDASHDDVSERALVVVNGRGKASAEPDVTVLRFEVSVREKAYSASAKNLNERVEALRRDLESAGVERRLLKTTSFNVRRDSRYDEKKKKHIFLGFVASHGMRLELPMDRDFLNRAIGHVAESASETSLVISFEVSDKEGLRREALKNAVVEARRSAEILTREAGASLGDVLKMNYGFGDVRHRSGVMFDADYALSKSTPDIEPEEVDAEQSVTIEWSIS